MILPTDRSDALAERLLGATLGALELHSVYLGSELGLYDTLERDGALTPDELAEHAGIAPRYAREWLEQQAVAGILDLEGDRYRLAEDHAGALRETAPLAHMLAGVGGVVDRLPEAYRSGAGVPYADYGRAFRHGQGHVNRPAFTDELPGVWLRAMPDVVARLERLSAPRIADVGCGQGWAALALARTFPHAWVDGIDPDPGSIADARRHAAEHVPGARLRFLQAGAEDIEGPYDLVTILEALHDMARPVEALAAIRGALAPDGTVLVVDERVADALTAPGDETERLMYGWSVTHCLPTQMVEQPSAALGTVLRAGTMAELAAEAGYARVETLPVEHEFFRLYRLHR
jgi:2-polyprenyl-3-methyl-5-hydroxy-6-metoxy-1,4-benzoquinol methylase